MRYTAQFASSLSPPDWQPNTNETVTPVGEDGLWERVVVEDTESAGTSPRRFGRVAVGRD